MDTQEWNQRHVEAYYNVKEALPFLEGIFVAYNSNIDAIKHLTKEDLDKLAGFFKEGGDSGKG